MAEKTAAEILVAQLEYEVAECKAALYRELFDAGAAPANSTVDAIEALVEKIVLRWWLGRMPKTEPKINTSPEELERMAEERQRLIVESCRLIAERAGPPDPRGLQAMFINQAAEVNALWGVLIESGLISPASRLDYLNASVVNTFNQVKAEHGKIAVARAVHDGLRTKR